MDHLYISMQLLITVKTQVQKKLLTEDREKLLMFGKLPVNCRKLFGKTQTDILFFNRVSVNLHPSWIFWKFSFIHKKLSEHSGRECFKNFGQAIDSYSLITGWTAYTKTINLSVLFIDLLSIDLPPIRQDFVVYIFPKTQSNKSLRRQNRSFDTNFAGLSGLTRKRQQVVLWTWFFLKLKFTTSYRIIFLKQPWTQSYTIQNSNFFAASVQTW